MAKRYQQPQSGPYTFDLGAPLGQSLAPYVADCYVGGVTRDVSRSLTLPKVITSRGVGFSNSNGSLGQNVGPAKLLTSNGAGSGDFSVLFVTNEAPSASNRGIVYMPRSNSFGDFFYVLTNAATSVANQSGSVSIGQGGLTLPGILDGKPHTIMFTRINGVVYGYVDGLFVASAAFTSAIWGNGAETWVGGYNSGGFGVTGGVALLVTANIGIASGLAIPLTANPWQLFAPAQRTSFRPAADGTAASVTATDGADVITANASVSVAISSATTDGADLLAGNASVIVSASSAKTDGADVLTANVTPQAATTSITSATTDGVDVLASSISVIATASSATTDGADTLVATVVPAGTAISSNTTDGADVLAAAVGPQVAAASATTDGADLLAASAGPIVGVSNAAVEGPDTLSSNVAPVQLVAVSAAIADGADVLAANVFTSSPPSGGAPSSDTRKTKRFLVQHEGRTLGFDTRRAAERAIRQLDGPAVLLAQPVVAVAATATRLTAQRVMDAAQEEEDELEMLLLAL